MVFIIIWKVAGEFVRPKNIIVGSKSPSGVRNAAFHSSPGFMRMLLYPHRISNLVNNVHPLRQSMFWGMRDEMLRLLFAHLFTTLYSCPVRTFPPFFLPHKMFLP